MQREKNAMIERCLSKDEIMYDEVEWGGGDGEADPMRQLWILKENGVRG